MKPVPNQFPKQDPGAIRLALVAEAPGADEVAMGYPLAGKSGWWLNQWLAQAGLSRYSCFVGNVSQMRPSPNSNEFDLLEWNGAEVQAGIAALQRDLAAFKPNCVVALGNAAFHLLRHGNTAPPKSQKLRLFQYPSRIGTWRGSLFEGARSFDVRDAATLHERAGRRAQLFKISGHISPTGCPKMRVEDATNTGDNASAPASGVINNFTEAPPHPHAAPQHPATRAGDAAPLPDLGGAATEGAPPIASKEPPLPLSWKCLCTYHPAATFRDPSATYPLVSDLKRAVLEAASPTLTLPRRDIVWGLSVAEVEARCEAIRARRTPVGFDIEGGLGGLQCLSFATSPNDAFVIDLMERDFDYARKMSSIAAVLEDPHVPKVCWNAAYERVILQAVASITLRGYEDGMLAWWERFSELPKALDFVASILTREPYWAEGIGWDKRTGAPKVTGAPFFLYNGLDSCLSLEIWEHPLVRAASESRTPVKFAL